MATATPEDIRVKVRTAGALKSGVAKSAEVFKAEHGWTFAPSFTHGPHIEEELARVACDADIVGLMDDAIGAAVARGLLSARRVPIGSIQIGVAIREGAERPDISNMEMFTAALRSADTLIYTTAASGEYMAGVLTEMGFIRRFEDKTVRYASGGEVNARLMAGKAKRELAFGVATEFLSNPKVIYLGPLPEEIQNPSPYEFAALSGRDSDDVRQVLDFLDTTRAREIFASTGVD
jgi:molybdate transport system substrate-binding protein